MLNAEKRCLCLGRNQNAGDCCFQRKDLGIIAARCKHRKGAHSAHSGGVRHRSVPDGLQTHWRNQRYVDKGACTENMEYIVKDTIINVFCPQIDFHAID